MKADRWRRVLIVLISAAVLAACEVRPDGNQEALPPELPTLAVYLTPTAPPNPTPAPVLSATPTRARGSSIVTVAPRITATLRPQPSPTPLLWDSNLDTESRCLGPGEASPVAFSLPAWRIVYAWRSNAFNLGTLTDAILADRDPAPDGSQNYDRKLLLDDKRPELKTDDQIALDARDFAGIADQYFRSLAARGVGIWDGCYGESTVPIMTSRVHFPADNAQGLRAGWQGHSWAEVLYTDGYVSQDAAVHEWTHGITTRLLPMFSEGGPDGQTGAIFESLADTFVVLWKGGGDYTVQHRTGIQRNLRTPKVADWDHRVREERPGDAKYLNSGIPSKAAYLIIEDIGKSKAELIYFHALNPDFYPPVTGEGQYTFQELALGVVAACKELANNGVEDIEDTDCDQAREAFRAVGMLRDEASPGCIVFDQRRQNEMGSVGGVITVMSPDGAGRIPLTSALGSIASYPSFSADGSHIVFSTGGRKADIYIMRANGSDLTPVTNNPDGVVDYDPTLSPDGARIAFTSLRDGNYEVYVMNADGSGAVNLSRDHENDGRPAWSPDGTKIAFVSWRSGNSDIWVMNADGSSPVNLTRNPRADEDPAWSPDGKRIAFASDREGASNIYIMDAGGGNVVRITAGESMDGQPAWSPDGQYIVYDSYQGAGLVIMRVRVDGAEQISLTTGDVSEGSPSWSPLPCMR